MCIYLNDKCLFLSLVADFTNVSITIVVPAATSPVPSFTLPQFFSVIDDDINEVEQRFAVVAEIGLDIPDTCYRRGECVCFQYPNSGDCHGRLGTTEIRIVDNDGK